MSVATYYQAALALSGHAITADIIIGTHAVDLGRQI